jgi:hypothetical protein
MSKMEEVLDSEWCLGAARLRPLTYVDLKSRKGGFMDGSESGALALVPEII